MEESLKHKEERLCGMCTTNKSKYCCPRCEILYCSLDCYKSDKHLECSEGFYQDCVNEELFSYHAGDEAKRKMIEILKKVKNENIEELEGNEIESIDSDDDLAIDLHERIKDLDLNDTDALWNVLTEDERNEFEAVVRGDVGSVLPQWEPWWMYNKEAKLVEEIQQTDAVDEHLKNCPCIKSVPKFNTLTNVKPSPVISFNITNVLASYAFIMRYFNGELDAIEAATHIMEVCQNLSSNANFDDLETAVESVAQKCLQSELIETDEVSLEVMKHDTFLLLKGPSTDNNAYYCKAALSHLIEIFNQVKSNLKTTKENVSKSEGKFSKKFPENMNYLPELDVSTVKRNIKKVEFYLSFIESNDNC